MNLFKDWWRKKAKITNKKKPQTNQLSGMKESTSLQIQQTIEDNKILLWTALCQ